ncbi:MAG TPA: glycan-binding surface protein [Paludibacter sp.]|nr:glycan-binding surface protein [Paludibacter sp.]
MQHRINKILTASFMACLLVGGLLFNSCKQEEVSLAPALSVFGPSPALRGGELKFVGTNLDKVTAVVLAGGLEITEITKTSSTEISITIPQTAKPGAITLKSSFGDIVTKTPLTFSEPISIDTYTTTAVKAGDVFTINGDYLNLIAQVVFSDGAVVDSSKFVSQSRKKIEVEVPKAAKTGKVAISNGAEIPIIVYTAGVVTVTDPTTLAAISPVPVKAGGALKITGTNLDLVKTVVIPDGIKVDSAGIVVNAEKTEITITVPEMAKEGDIKLVTYSGTEMTVPQQLKLVAPAITSAAPLLVKNGEKLTITGTDLDLVTSVNFGAVAGTISSQSATVLEVTVPMTATDGVVALNTNSGLTATSEALTMVKPAFTSISPLALTAGDKVTINGTDLDLVRKVVFMGGTVDVTPAGGATSLEVTVPTTSVGTGAVKLETVNGTQVVSSDQLEIKASTTPAIVSITECVPPEGLMTITGKNLNFVESIYFEDNVKAVLYGVRSETSITVYIPKEAKHGRTTFTMHSFSGELITSSAFVYGTDPVTDPAYVFFNFDGKNSWWGDKGSIENNSALTLDGSNYFRVNDDMNPWWTGFFWRNGKNDLKTDGVTVADWAVKIDVNVLADIAGPIKFRLKGTDGDFWSPITNLKNQGGWYTITLPLTSFATSDGSVHLTDLATIDSDFGMAYGGPGEHVNMCIDNVRFERISGAAGVRGFKLIGM